MSAELIKSKFVRCRPSPEVVRRPSSVRVAIVSVPNVPIAFKCWLLLFLGHTLGRCLGNHGYHAVC